MRDHHVFKNHLDPESKTTSTLLDSKGLAAYDASTLDGSEVRAGARHAPVFLRCAHPGGTPLDETDSKQMHAMNLS